MTAANLPAALAGTRVSPLDDGNLNRAYPGDPDGGPTKAIAHYIDSVIFPLTQYYQDLHSGGSSLDYLPFVSVHRGANPALDNRAIAAMQAFGGPLGLIWGHSLDSGLGPVRAGSRGIVTLGGEFGGGGSATRPGVALVERAVRNLLAYAGVVEGKTDAAPGEAMRLRGGGGARCFVVAPQAGVL